MSERASQARSAEVLRGPGEIAKRLPGVQARRERGDERWRERVRR